MENMTIHLLADARTASVVDAELQPINGLTTFFKEVPVEITLFLYDLDGRPYAEEELQKRTWAFVIADDFNEDTPPQLRASTVEAVGANELKITLPEMNTVELAAVLGTEKSVRLGAELYGKLFGETVDNWVMQFSCQVRNRRESVGVPTNVKNNYYVKAEVDDKLSDKQDAADAFSGDYNDLSNTPTIPTKTSQLENDDAYIKYTDKFNSPNLLLKLNEIGLVPDSCTIKRLNHWFVDSFLNLDYNKANIHFLYLEHEVTTITISNLPICATLVFIVNNGNGKSLLFGDEEIISSSETGQYVLIFSDLYNDVKLYNKIES